MKLVSRRAVFRGLSAGLVVPAGLVLPAGFARADNLENWEPLLRKVVPRRWHGYASWSSSGSDDDDDDEGSNEINLEVTFNFEFTYGLMLGGYYFIQTTWNDVDYSADFILGGTCWEQDNHVGVRIDSTHLSRADVLPADQGLFWQGLTGSMEFFNDADSPDSYRLDGTLYGSEDNTPFDVSVGT